MLTRARSSHVDPPAVVDLGHVPKPPWQVPQRSAQRMLTRAGSSHLHPPAVVDLGPHHSRRSSIHEVTKSVFEDDAETVATTSETRLSLHETLLSSILADEDVNTRLVEKFISTWIKEFTDCAWEFFGAIEQNLTQDIVSELFVRLLEPSGRDFFIPKALTNPPIRRVSTKGVE